MDIDCKEFLKQNPVKTWVDLEDEDYKDIEFLTLVNEKNGSILVVPQPLVVIDTENRCSRFLSENRILDQSLTSLLFFLFVEQISRTIKFKNYSPAMQCAAGTFPLVSFKVRDI